LYLNCEQVTQKAIKLVMKSMAHIFKIIYNVSWGALIILI